MPTIKEVSQRANVSPSTVSRVLNGTTPVSPEAAHRVLKAVKELDYTPNTFARSLATNRSGGFGVTMNDVGSPYYGTMLRGIESALQEASIHLLVSSGHADAERERSAIRFLEQRRSDALIIQAEALPDEELIRLAQTADVPIVIFGRLIPELEGKCVHFDNEAGGELATQHLIDAGHRKIAHISGPLGFPDSRHRMQGYRQALMSAGIDHDDRFVVEGDFLEAGGYSAMQRLLARNAVPDAVFAANDQMAAGAMRAARDAGFDIPQDISFVGFDDVVLARYLSPALTTVRQPLHKMGRAAAIIALAQLEKREVEVRTRFEPELAVRESVTLRAS